VVVSKNACPLSLSIEEKSTIKATLNYLTVLRDQPMQGIWTLDNAILEPYGSSLQTR